MFSRKTYIAQLNYSWNFDRGANCFHLCFAEVLLAPHYNVTVFVSKFFTRLQSRELSSKNGIEVNFWFNEVDALPPESKINDRPS